MSSTPKTIQIFLPSGEPHGIRIILITTGGCGDDGLRTV
jgi:hypothetical protein